MLRSSGIAELDTPLEHRDGAGLCLKHDLDRLRQHLVVAAETAFSILGGLSAVAAGILVLGSLAHEFLDLAVVLRRTARALLDEADDILALLIGNERALDTYRLSAADGRKQHIAHADKLFRHRPGPG